MIPLVPIVVVGAAVAAVVAYEHAKRSPHGRILQALDAHMPAKLRALVAQSVTSTGIDPKKLATLAKKLEPTYPAAAAVVATRVIQTAAPKPQLVSSLGSPTQVAAATHQFTPLQMIHDDILPTDDA
jgi:uncharacterized BrkB/YihY/UPF0761 family membrane protein